MTWFVKKGGSKGDPMDSALRTYTVPKDRLVMIEAKPGEIIPCDDPQNVVIVPPKDPEPDLSTKPKDIVGYCFGYVCPKKHVHGTFDGTTTDGYKERRACNECGKVAKPAVIKRIAEAAWDNRAYPTVYDRNPKPNWGWYNSYVSGLGKTMNFGDTLWTNHEFVHYLDTPTRRKKK